MLSVLDASCYQYLTKYDVKQTAREKYRLSFYTRVQYADSRDDHSQTKQI